MADLASAYWAAADGLKRPDLEASARACLDRLQTATDREGRVRRRLDEPKGERGLLDDQLSAARAGLAAYLRRREARDLGYVRRTLAYAERSLRDPETGAMRVRAAGGGPVAGWIEPVDPDATASAALIYDDLAVATGDSGDARRARTALDWALARAEAVDPVLLGRTALRALRP